MNTAHVSDEVLARQNSENSIMRFAMDGHCHLHDVFATGEFLGSLLTNLSQISPADAHGAILVGMNGRHPFDQLRAAGSDWTFEDIEPDRSLVATWGDNRLYFIAAHQTVSNERIEVINVGPHPPATPGEAKSLVQSAVDRGELAILPWGFGKWTGQRGRVLRAFLDEFRGNSLVALGDNRGRPGRFADPASLADEFNLQVLPGTDTLAMESELHHAGRYGFEVDIDTAAPYQTLLAAIKETKKSTTSVIGRTMNPVSAFATQIRWQMYGRRSEA